MKHILILSFITFFTYNSFWSQGNNVGKNLSRFVNFGVLPAQTSIINKDVYNASNLTQTPGFTLNASAELELGLSKSFSFITGLGYSSYSSTLGMNNYTNNYNTKDSENDNFNMRIAGSGIVEEQKISCLSIPVKAQLQVPLSEKLSVFVNSGIMISSIVSKTYTGSGNFDYQGFYPAYNITLFNLPDYGFSENEGLNETGTLELKPLIFNFVASLGFGYKLSESLKLCLGMYYNQSLTNISNYSIDDFQLSKTSGNYNSLMGSASDVRLRAFGANLTVKIKL